MLGSGTGLCVHGSIVELGLLTSQGGIGTSTSRAQLLAGFPRPPASPPPLPHPGEGGFPCAGCCPAAGKCSWLGSSRLCARLQSVFRFPSPRGTGASQWVSISGSCHEVPIHPLSGVTASTRAVAMGPLCRDCRERKGCAAAHAGNTAPWIPLPHGSLSALSKWILCPPSCCKPNPMSQCHVWKALPQLSDC